jgi:CheY-like chemotaxis protein/nitrogen-specific signal transduction histidine kinase
VAQHCAQALDRARLYDSAKRAQVEAEAASREKDNFLSIVSHELRTPLNAILGWASMLQDGTLKPGMSDRAVRSIYTNATRQSRLIEELLESSRIVAGRMKFEFEEVDVPTLLQGVIESVLPTAAAKSIEIVCSPFPPAWLHADVRRLEQVFLNVLSNALKFTRAGGRVEIDAQQIEESLIVRISDNGVGIDAGFLPYVFDRFRQAENARTRSAGGLGLGLAIAKQLVEAHRGTISVESPGMDLGSTFKVTLPVAGPLHERRSIRAADRNKPASDATADEITLDDIRVLVVDDEGDTRDLIATVLESKGASVRVAESVTEAFSILKDGRIDVVLTDLALPGEDGHALVRRLRQSPDRRMAAIPAVAVTADARAEARSQALAAGFHLYLPKPIDPTDLVREVGRLVSRGRVH